MSASSEEMKGTHILLVQLVSLVPDETLELMDLKLEYLSCLLDDKRRELTFSFCEASLRVSSQ